MEISQQTSQTITAGIICALGIAVFGFMVLYQNSNALKEMDNDIKKLGVQIEEHRTLFPLFKTLLGKIRQQKAADLPYPEKTKLARDDMETAMSLLKSIAETYHLKIEEMQPEIDSVAGTSGHLIINITMKGELFNFRGLLIRLGRIPWFETVERLQIRSGDAVKEIRLKISIAIA